MNRSRLRNWLEGIGVFAVVASLIFLGLQVQREGINASELYAHELLSVKKSELANMALLSALMGPPVDPSSAK